MQQIYSLLRIILFMSNIVLSDETDVVRSLLPPESDRQKQRKLGLGGKCEYVFFTN